jgi:hypothetical protein
MKKIRVYADTSVFGGCFDEEFAKESVKFFEEVRKGKYSLALSDILLTELDKAPTGVKSVLDSIPPNLLETISATEEIIILRDSYLREGILTVKAINDASHIAVASVAEVDLLVSWNFKHIVHYDKIRGFNAVNMLLGYKPILIYSPKEVIEL